MTQQLSPILSTSLVLLLYEKNKEGTKIKNENGETYCRQFGQSRPLWGGYVLKEGLSHLIQVFMTSLGQLLD